jgi:ParB family chromosome partitioning protein
MNPIPLSQLHLPAGVKVKARLLRSIREKGVLVPILVVRNGSGYEILDGRRRALAAQKAGLSEVPAMIVEGGGPEITLLAHATRSENPLAELEAIRALQRRGLSE